MKKKLLAAMLVVVMVLTMIPVVQATTASGRCGDNLTWNLSDTGVLTISGSGEMWDFDEASEVPWRKYRASIKTIKIGANVTEIGEYAFSGHNKLTTVTIPASVREIGEKAFYNCDSLKSVVIGKGVREIDDKAFADCDVLNKVTFRGKAPDMEEDAFRNVKATCYYPANDSSWTQGKRWNYGGSLTWKKSGATTVSAVTVKASNVAKTGKVKLTWNAVNGAVKYKIYRSTSENGKYSLMKTVTGTSMINLNAVAGKYYFYYVVAIDANGNTSAKSNIVGRTCDLPRPEVTVKLNSNGKPVLTWNRVTGADEYEVFIYNAAGKLLNTPDVDGNKFTHKGAVSGVKYTYRVVAEHDKDAADSAKSVAVSIKAK